MSLFQARCAGAIGPEQTCEARERFMELIGVAQRNFEEAELMVAGAARFRGECQRNDWGFGAHVFQMRMKHAEQCVDIASGSRHPKGVFVIFARLQANAQMQFAGHKVDDFEAPTKLFDEALEHEEEWLERFNRVFKFDRFFKNSGWDVELQRPNFVGGNGVVKFDGFGAEAFGEFVFSQSEKSADGVDAPFLQDFGNFGWWGEAFDGQLRNECVGMVDE